jgi:GNAT superfamily N-acetyltransferase
MTFELQWGDPADAALRAAFARPGERSGAPADADPTDGAIALGLALRGGEPLARASLWLADDLAGAPGRSGLVGHYASLEGGAGVALLHAAHDGLAARGAVRVLGPINGSTWRRYRLELPREAGDPDVRPDGFASEPRNPARYPEEFAAAGFEVVARYESRIELDVRPDDAHAAARERARAHGMRMHALDSARFEPTLVAMHAMSLEAFAANPYYAPLPREEFLALYAPFRERVVPSLVRLATGPDGALAGYLFGYVDPLGIVDGRPLRTVCKTVAVAPHARSAGLGGLLLEDFRVATRALGIPGMIHALMHVSNASMRMSARHHSVPFKRYALFGRGPRP